MQVHPEAEYPVFPDPHPLIAYTAHYQCYQTQTGEVAVRIKLAGPQRTGNVMASIALTQPGIESLALMLYTKIVLRSGSMKGSTYIRERQTERAGALLCQRQREAESHRQTGEVDGRESWVSSNL